VETARRLSEAIGRGLHIPILAAVVAATLGAVPARASSSLAGQAVEPIAGADGSEAAPAYAGFTAQDTPNDNGSSITLLWSSTGMMPEETVVLVYRMTQGGPGFAEVGRTLLGVEAYEDTRGIDPGIRYRYRLGFEDGSGIPFGPATEWIEARPQWFNGDRLEVAVAVLILCFLVLFSIRRARRGAEISIRRIPGLEAVDEAVGRATEMGRPILFSPGLDEADQPGTIAALGILGKVMEKAAASGTRTLVPNRDPVVMTVAREIGREACLIAGRPELHRDADIYYATYSQFGYAAAVAGTMAREKPAVNFFMGKFYGEALVLAETGYTTGAMQIAGSDSDTQLPFFITTCDYTLMGEELYAASAYLSREPVLTGSLRGQDAAKLILIALMGAGLVLAVFGIDLGALLR